MKRKIRSMLSTALIVSMLGTMFSGTAFAAGIKKAEGLFKDNDVPYVFYTENRLGSDYFQRVEYERGKAMLASPANAVMASDSEALAASPSELLKLSYNKFDSSLSFRLADDQDAFWPALDDAYTEQGGFPLTVGLCAGEEDRQFQGKIEIRSNWFMYVESANYSSPNYDRVNQKYLLPVSRFASPSEAGKVDLNNGYTLKIRQDGNLGTDVAKDFAPSVKSGTGGNGGIELTVPERLKAESGRNVDKTFNVELRKGSELIGYTWFDLPMYSGIDDGNGGGEKTYFSVSEYLSGLSGEEKAGITELKINKGDITSDEWRQLMELPNLKKLYLSKDLSRVNIGGTGGNQALEELYINYDGTAAKSSPTRSMQGTIWEIPTGAFADFTKLKKVSMPGVTKVREKAFKGAVSLDGLTAPDVQDIEDSAFSGCGALTSADLPSLYNMGNNVFKDCAALNALNLPKLYNAGESVFVNCRALTSIDLPSLYSISHNAFKDCAALSAVNLPKLYSTGDSAFANCASLTSVALPQLEYTGERLFENCAELTVADLPSLDYLRGFTFAGCTALSEVKIRGVYQLSPSAFQGLNNIALELPSYNSPTLLGDFEAEQRFTASFIDRRGNEVSGDALLAAKRLYAWDAEWRRVLGLTPDGEETGELKIGYGILGQRPGTLTGKTMDEIIDRIGRLGALSDVIRIELNDSKLTKADWDAMQRLTGLQELEMGTPDWIETSAYKRTIPEGATVPKSLRIARLYTAVNIPAGMFKDCTQLNWVSIGIANHIGDEAFAGCTSLNRLIIYLHNGGTPPVLGRDVFKGCTSSKKTIDFSPTGNEAALAERYKAADPQWAVWFEGGTPPPSGSASSGSNDRGSKYGSWVQDAGGWMYIFNDFRPVFQWGYLPYGGKFAWYYFDQNGYMMTGWYTDASGRTYYLNPVSDGTRGRMMTGWNQIDGKWYYFSMEEGSENGMLLKNTTTPDGYKVDADGVWIQ